MKNNKGFSLVELIIVIAIMAILVGVMAPQLIKYIEKSKVSSDTQLADSVHSAVITSMMDPEVALDNTAAAYINSIQNNTETINTLASSTGNKFQESVAEILGVTSGAEVTSSLKSTRAASSEVQVELNNNSCSVIISGTDSRGSKDTTGTYNIGVY